MTKKVSTGKVCPHSRMSLYAALLAGAACAVAMLGSTDAQASQRYAHHYAPAAGVAFAQQELGYINAYRAQMGQPPLVLLVQLDAVAQSHSQGMLAANTMSHEGFYDRFHQSGFTHCVENVGWNYTTPGALFAAWRASPHHNENMLNPNIHYAGVSIVGPYSTLFACN